MTLNKAAQKVSAIEKRIKANAIEESSQSQPEGSDSEALEHESQTFPDVRDHNIISAPLVRN